ncbi:MAG: hypothetical protein ABSC01_08835 [Verrucomicrobiota bacterium]|jgi:hypothetical protein
MKLTFHFLSLIIVATLCGNSHAENIPLPNNKVVLEISLQEKLRLFTRLGFTNILSHGPVERDSKGTRLFIRVETGTNFATTQESRTQQLVVVAADGVHVKPWHFPANERVAEDEKLAVWQVGSGESLPAGCNIKDVSGNWITVTEPNHAPWIARLDAPPMRVQRSSIK